MKGVYLEKPWNIEVKEVKQKAMHEGDALICIKSAGICGSDLGAYRGTNQLVSYPRIIGHELAGIVEEICPNEKGIKAGDRVVVDPYLYCGICYPCSIGRTNCCIDLKVLGVHIDGGMVEKFVHPANMLIKAPDNIPWDILPMAEPLTIALHGLHRLQLKSGEYIAISGAGPIGLLAALSARCYGAVPILIDPIDKRLDYGKYLGVSFTINPTKEKLVEKVLKYTQGQLAECVMEASGAETAIRSSLDIVRNAGRIALTGWPKQEISLPTDIITKKELDVRGARTSAGEFEEALELISSGKVDVRSILTKTVTVDEVPKTIEDMEKNPQNYLKVNVLF